MIPELEFIQPASMAEVLEILHESTTSTKIIAGGTDIIPGFQQNSNRFKGIERIVDISHLNMLKEIILDNDHLLIGAAATFSQIQANPLIKKYFPLLVESAGRIGSVQIRNRATIAGNFVNNAPCADSVAPLLVYDAQIKICSKNHDRILPLNKFLAAPYGTNLKLDELVENIIIPIPDPGFYGEFYKLGRRRGVAVSRISLAVLTKISDSIIQEIRIASGAITPVGMRFQEVEDKFTGKKVNPEILKDLSRSIGEKILEITGLRWSSAYKLPVVQQMFYQVMQNIVSKADE